MEEYFDKLLYLVVGIIYFALTNVKKQNTEERPATNTPSVPPATPAARTDRVDMQGNQIQYVPQSAPLPQTSIAKTPLCLAHSTSTQSSIQQRPGKKTERIFHQYRGWKKAIIMSELIQPYA